MTMRLIALIPAVAAVALVAACGSTDSATPAPTSVVTVTTVVAAPSTIAQQATQDSTAAPEPTTAEAGGNTPAPAPAATRTSQPVAGGTGASAYVGHYQRHESTLDLAANRTGTLLQGASALDGERWAVSWKAAGQGISITYERLLEKSGAGLEAGLVPGRTFTAHFATGETGNQVLATSAIPPEIIASIWCLPNRPSPECGA